MQWSPFSHIVENKTVAKFPFFTLLMIAATLPLFYYAYIGNGAAIDTDSEGHLTTTIDFAHKEILDQAPIPEAENNMLVKAAIFIKNAYAFTTEDSLRLASLAAPGAEYVKIIPGMRKEQVVEAFSKKLGWSKDDELAFFNSELAPSSSNLEGYYFPGTYLVTKDTAPSGASAMALARFSQEIMPKYASSTASIINVDTAVKVASIIQRETSGTKADMRLISGIIWNRIFRGMDLQIDATLQYALGTKANGWWPPVHAEDKYIDSPYNTYQNEGFPPSPISNPNLAAISAALNPTKTNCLFYIHDNNQQIHCAATYAQHEANIKRYLK